MERVSESKPVPKQDAEPQQAVPELAAASSCAALNVASMTPAPSSASLSSKNLLPANAVRSNEEAVAEAPSEETPPCPTQSGPPVHLSCTTAAFWKQLLRFVGPGFLISMAYIDPGNLSADINQGVVGGYTLSWVTLWSTFMGYLIQMLSAKLGMVTGKDLAQLCRTHLPVFPRLALWATTELGIVATDMIEVIGGAVALRTLSSGAVPLWAGVLITAAGGFAVLALERWGMRVLEAVLVALISIMAGTFGYMFFSTGVDYGAVAKGLVVPHLDSNTIQVAVGAVGAIIMPHNIFLHSALVLTHPDALTATGPTEALRYVRIESGVALLLACIINVFIIAVSAHSFSTPQPSQAFDPSQIGLGNAGDAFAALYGNAILYIWGVGLLAAAFASTVTSTYAGQVVTSGFLRLKLSTWWRTAAVRLFTLGPTLSVALLVRSEGQLTVLTEILNVIQSIVLPLVVIPLLTFTSSKKIMGVYANRPWSVVALVLVLLFLTGMNGYLAVSFAINVIPATAWARVLFGFGCALYVCFMLYLLAAPHRVHKFVKAAVARARPALDRVVDVMDVHI